MQESQNTVVNMRDATVAQRIYHLIPQLTVEEMEVLRNELYWESERVKETTRTKIEALGKINNIRLG